MQINNICRWFIIKKDHWNAYSTIAIVWKTYRKHQGWKTHTFSTTHFTSNVLNNEQSEEFMMTWRVIYKENWHIEMARRPQDNKITCVTSIPCVMFMTLRLTISFQFQNFHKIWFYLYSNKINTYNYLE